MFNYYGSKARLSSTYQQPRHSLIVEPFAGSAAYSMRWLSERSDAEAVLVEIDEHVCELWVRLLAMSPSDIMDIPTPVAGERTTDLLVALSASATSVQGAMHNQGSAQVTKWQARDWETVKRRVAATRARVSSDRVTVIHGDYTAAPDVEATWFIDPPYQTQGTLYVYGSDAIDYDALGVWAVQREGQVIVTEAEPASWLPFNVHTTHTGIVGSGVELVWYSDPDPTLF